MHRLFLTFIFFGLLSNASGQTWEVGGFAGGAGYMGDLNPTRPYKVTNAAFGGQLKRNFDGNWSLKLNLVRAKIQADDADSPDESQNRRNLNFHSPLAELSLQTEFNFFKYIPGSLPGYGNHRLTPYLFTGVGGALFNPKTVTDDGRDVELQPLQTENTAYKKYGLVIPYGAGVKYNFLGNWNVISELGYRTVFNDYLDDVSGSYADKNILSTPDAIALSDRSTGQIATAGTQRGDFRKRDTYMFVGISLTYTFVLRKCAFE